MRKLKSISKILNENPDHVFSSKGNIHFKDGSIIFNEHMDLFGKSHKVIKDSKHGYDYSTVDGMFRVKKSWLEKSFVIEGWINIYPNGTRSLYLFEDSNQADRVPTAKDRLTKVKISQEVEFNVDY